MHTSNIYQIDRQIHKIMNKTYKIRIQEHGSVSYDIELTTEDLEWSMEQYQRNRDFFTWEIIE